MVASEEWVTFPQLLCGGTGVDIRTKPVLAAQPMARPERSDPLREAAEGMEAQFLKEMMRNMRKTVQESPEAKANHGLQVFRGMLDDQYAEKAAKNQGVGLSELIVRQVMEMQEQARTRGMPVAIRGLNERDVIRNLPPENNPKNAENSKIKGE